MLDIHAQRIVFYRTCIQNACIIVYQRNADNVNSVRIASLLVFEAKMFYKCVIFNCFADLYKILKLSQLIEASLNQHEKAILQCAKYAINKITWMLLFWLKLVQLIVVRVILNEFLFSILYLQNYTIFESALSTFWYLDIQKCYLHFIHSASIDSGS